MKPVSVRIKPAQSVRNTPANIWRLSLMALRGQMEFQGKCSCGCERWLIALPTGQIVNVPQKYYGRLEELNRFHAERRAKPTSVTGNSVATKDFPRTTESCVRTPNNETETPLT